VINEIISKSYNPSNECSYTEDSYGFGESNIERRKKQVMDPPAGFKR